MKNETYCATRGIAAPTWAMCACGSIFTGARSIERRAEHIAKGEGNWLAGTTP